MEHVATQNQILTIQEVAEILHWWTQGYKSVAPMGLKSTYHLASILALNRK